MLKKTLIISSIAVASVPVFSAEFAFEPRIQAGYMDYELTMDPKADEAANEALLGARVLFPGAVIDAGQAEVVRGGIDRFKGKPSLEARDRGGKNSIDDSFFVLGLGGVLSYDAYFADFYYQESVDGEADTFSRNPEDRLEIPEEPRRKDNGAIPVNFNVSNLDIDRKDYSISIGRGFEVLGNPLSVFIGYRNGQTEIHQTRQGDSIGRPKDFADGVPTNNTISTDIEMDGPYIGAAYGFGVGNGILGFNLGIAKLDASYDFNEVAIRSDNKVVNSSVNTNFSGDATGINFGISWKAPITEKLRYALALNYYNYDFDLTGTAQGTDVTRPSQNQVINDIKANLEEEALTALLSLSYSF